MCLCDVVSVSVLCGEKTPCSSVYYVYKALIYVCLCKCTHAQTYKTKIRPQEEGGYKTLGKEQPVACISWPNTVVWCICLILGDNWQNIECETLY